MLYDIAFKDVPWCTRTEGVHGEHAKPGETLLEFFYSMGLAGLMITRIKRIQNFIAS